MEWRALHSGSTGTRPGLMSVTLMTMPLFFSGQPLALQRMLQTRSAGAQPHLLPLGLAGAAGVESPPPAGGDDVLDPVVFFVPPPEWCEVVGTDFFLSVEGASSAVPEPVGGGNAASVGVGVGVGAGAATGAGGGGATTTGGGVGFKITASATITAAATIAIARKRPVLLLAGASAERPPTAMGEPKPSGAATPRGAVASGAIAGAPMPPPLPGSARTAAAVSAFRSMRPEASREAGLGAGTEGRVPVARGFHGDVRALREKSTDDSLRDPVAPELPPLASGALVATSSSLPARSMRPNKSLDPPRAGRAAARAALADAPPSQGDAALGAEPRGALLPALMASMISSTSASGFQSAKPSAHTYVSPVICPAL